MDAAALSAKAAAWVKLPGGAADEAMSLAAEAVLAMLTPSHGEPGSWDKMTELGAVMLTARLHRRRNSPNGVESLTEMGASYVSRYDSDIARMLNIDAFARPVVV